jgi:hypothetical protein
MEERDSSNEEGRISSIATIGEHRWTCAAPAEHSNHYVTSHVGATVVVAQWQDVLNLFYANAELPTRGACLVDRNC